MAVEDSPGTSSGDAEKVAAAASNVVGDIRSQLGQPPPAEQPPSSSETGNEPGSLDGTYRLDLGDGVHRDVSSKELLDSFLARQESEEASRVAQASLQKSVGAQTLLAELEGMDEPTRNGVLQLLRDPQSMMARMNAPQQRAQPGEQDPDLEQILSDVAGGKSRNGTQSPDLVAAVQQLAQRQEQIMGHLNGQIAAERTETFAEQVNREMEAFPVFKESGQGKNWAHESAMQEIAANPQGDVKAIVARHATNLHGILKGKSAPAPAPRDPRGRINADDLHVPENQPGGDDLMNGGVAKRLRAALDELDGR